MQNVVKCARIRAQMLVINHGERNSRFFELPESLLGLLVLVVVLVQACFGVQVASCIPALGGESAQGVLLSALAALYAFVVLLHLVFTACRHRKIGRFLWLQLLACAVTSAAFYYTSVHAVPVEPVVVNFPLGLMSGVFSFINLRAMRKEYYPDARTGRVKRSRPNPAFSFFVYMAVLVAVSTVLLVSPGATQHPISWADAFFLSASATSITGLTPVDVAGTFTTFGKMVLLLDIQVGALGVMTFTYFVLMLVGKRLTMRDSMKVSGYLDQDGGNRVAPLLRVVGGVTLGAELIGAVILFFLLRNHLKVSDVELVGYSVFHAVSAFCNAGITLFPDDMSTECVARAYPVQIVMMFLMFIGTVGFGVWQECIHRLRHKKSRKRWSTHTWLVFRVTLITMLIGIMGMCILSVIEPWLHPNGPLSTGAEEEGVLFGFWESIWNSIGRSAGFSLSDISEHGVVYKLFLCVLMFVGGNPAGTGGGVYAPVVAICVLEVIRILRGAHDVEIHNRRIARGTVDRAIATVLLSFVWIGGTTMLVLLAEPGLAAQEGGLLKVFFMEVSAFTTTGFDLGAVEQLSVFSKLVVSLNMLFGRVGMFTCMLMFISPKEPSPARFPETRLPLT